MKTTEINNSTAVGIILILGALLYAFIMTSTASSTGFLRGEVRYKPIYVHVVNPCDCK